MDFLLRFEGPIHLQGPSLFLRFLLSKKLQEAVVLEVNGPLRLNQKVHYNHLWIIFLMCIFLLLCCFKSNLSLD